MLPSIDDYKQFTYDLVALISEFRSLPVPQFTFPSDFRSPVPDDAPTMVIIESHPDDAAITGALALRLRREGWKVIVICVTLGSLKERQYPRYLEDVNSCNFLGFSHRLVNGDCALSNIKESTRESDRYAWDEAVDSIVRQLSDIEPEAIIFPHADDGNTTHGGVYYLTTDALERMGDFSVVTVEAEYWHQIQRPNLLLQVSTSDASDLVVAILLHRGEVARNDYHVRHIPWLINNVRIGAEVVGGQGAGVPDNFDLGIMYKVRLWTGGRFEGLYENGKIVSLADDLEAILRVPALV